jgi:hypothetical protein
VGIHSAADTERDWPWYGRLVGAWSSGHPEIQPAVAEVVTPTDASTAGLPARWSRTDEWYGFLTNPRANGVRVLLTLDESTYVPQDWAMGADHPIAWEHSFDGGRAWYTELGHTEASYAEPLYLAHLLGGIRYALAAAPLQTSTAPEPAIRSLSVKVRQRQVAVSFRAASCAVCTARLVVHSKAVRLRIARGVARGSTAVLPAGRWRVAVELTDLRTGRKATARRWVRVS